MEPSLSDKYRLKDLFKEIDLLDRKIAHAEAYEAEDERAATLKKLKTKRDQLTKKAQQLGGPGDWCDPKDLPRSFKKEEAKGARAA
ncbi:MAG TPA: hypothetical protein VD837_10515 [Terriglobales bacterium]|nr:hypothetical protein [Terriglobales bacterium]